MLSDDLVKHLYEMVIDGEQSRAKIYSPKKILGLLKIWTNLMTLAVQENQKKLHIKVLDYGCGWGDFLAVASAHGIHCTGFETDSRKASFAREMGATVLEAEEDISAAAPFDIIYCHHVLEHVPNPGTVLNKFNTWLLPEGYGWVAVPHCAENFINDMRQRLSRAEPLAKEVNPWEHLNYFTPHSFSAMLERNGFVVVSPGGDNSVSKQTSHNRGIIKSLLKKAMDPQRQHEAVPGSTAVYIRKKQK
jgi:cyclopropane fatty-acyl-phospholipid synthase-like methyltransferase